MAGLTIKQLEQLEDVLRWGDMAANASGRIYDAIDIVRAEIARRKHGPFTLAEAIASGRPLRRKAWAPLSWARISEHVYNGGALIVFVVGGSAIPVGPNDITAVDYELQEGGEE